MDKEQDPLDVMIRVCRDGFNGRCGVHMNETDCSDLIDLFEELQRLRPIGRAVRKVLEKPKTSVGLADALLAGDRKRAVALTKPDFDAFNDAWDELEKAAAAL